MSADALKGLTRINNMRREDVAEFIKWVDAKSDGNEDEWPGCVAHELARFWLENDPLKPAAAEASSVATPPSAMPLASIEIGEWLTWDGAEEPPLPHVAVIRDARVTWDNNATLRTYSDGRPPLCQFDGPPRVAIRTQERLTPDECMALARVRHGEAVFDGIATGHEFAGDLVKR